MDAQLLTAIVNAIKRGVLAENSPLSAREFQAIREAVALVNRRWAIELVAEARKNFKQHVEALAARID